MYPHERVLSLYVGRAGLTQYNVFDPSTHSRSRLCICVVDYLTFLFPSVHICTAFSHASGRRGLEVIYHLLQEELAHGRPQTVLGSAHRLFTGQPNPPCSGIAVIYALSLSNFGLPLLPFLLIYSLGVTDGDKKKLLYFVCLGTIGLNRHRLKWIGM